MPLPPGLQKKIYVHQKQLLSESLLLELEEFLKRKASRKRNEWHMNFNNEENILSFHKDENVRIEDELGLDHLKLLEEIFAKHIPRDGGEKPTKKNAGLWWIKRSSKAATRQPGNMTLHEFQEALQDMLGSDQWNSQMELLFNKVDTACDGFVDWSEFCTYMLLQYREKDYVTARKETFAKRDPLIRHCVYNKQEPTTRILAITSPPPLYFVSVSKEGSLTVWDSSLHIQRMYELSSESSDTYTGKKIFKSWATDAVYMPDVHKIAVTTTSRDIHFFDVSTTNYFEEFHLFALSHVPKALYYWHDGKFSGNRSLLLWGDDTGDVHLLWFLKPHKGMFEKPFTDEEGPQKIFIQDMKEHFKLLSYEIISEVLQEAICRIMYVPEGDLIIASSGSSVIIADIERKKKAYTWKINKGVTCFDFNKSLNLLVTGGMDHKVRLWNQYVTNRPIALLQGHYMAILDVAIYESLGQVFSFSKDSILKVWDISSENCLQSLVLKFPCVQPGHFIEYGEFPFLLVTQDPRVLLVSCADYIAMLNLDHTDLENETHTHSAPLCSAIYNSFFCQVATGSDDSTITLWDVKTGTKCLLLNNVHGNEEITCMAFDSPQRRLITGARNGTIKINPTGQGSFSKWTEEIYYTIKTQGQMPKDLLSLDPTSGSEDQPLEMKANNMRPNSRHRIKHKKEDGLQPPVDKLLFLQNRASNEHMVESAILLSSEAGFLYWWSIFGSRRKVGRYYAPEKTDESILALSASPTNNVLVSADTCGYVHVWDISTFGMSSSHRRLSKKPPLLYSWKAHDGTVVSAEYFTFELSPFIITGSSDRTARLWTSDGKYVGTFGQEKKWDLKNPATYLHPKDPWGQVKEVSRKKSLQREQQAIINVLLQGEAKAAASNEQRKEGILKENDRGIMSIFQKGEEEEANTSASSGCNQRSFSCSQISFKDFDNQKCGKVSPDTCSNGKLAPTSKALTRLPEEKGLLHRAMEKKQRRSRLGEINVKKLSRFGTICSPFQALTIPDVQEITLPQDLPMSSRMLNVGMTCTTESELRTLPLTKLDQEDENESDKDLKQMWKAPFLPEKPPVFPFIDCTELSVKIQQ
ncbi:WD repeat-containing protein on Y chromosome-like [Protopterus annectens]|uniref:WD repeat-containing protein on Y chromosome-like n=1 Tax=Protopterus annectens TaxID=7888 RepID=UPI001CFA5FA3|nr:WD repeat-containing protein on Y chromosome-like [Protopterus annectens]